MLNDTIESTVLGYVFVHSFKWKEVLKAEETGGNPLPGEVYRYGYNKNTGQYRIIFEHKGMSAVLLPRLVVDEESEADHFCRISVITKSNILDLALPERELDTLISYIEDEHKTIKKVLNMENKTVAPFEPEDDVKYAIRTLLELRSADGALFDAIVYVTAHTLEVHEETSESYAEISLTLGAGHNIGRAIDHLHSYGSDNTRHNLQEEDLMEAIRNLIVEFKRRQIHGIG